MVLRRLLVVAVVLARSSGALAQEYAATSDLRAFQVHRFVSQGFLVTSDNNVFKLEVARTRASLRDLLSETQRQAERLTVQEEELRSANEELQVQIVEQHNRKIWLESELGRGSRFSLPAAETAASS